MPEHTEKSGQRLLLSSGKNALCLAQQKKIHCKHSPAGTLKRLSKVPEHLNQTPDDSVQPWKKEGLPKLRNQDLILIFRF